MTEVAFFAGAIGALGGAIAVVALRNPFYSVLALIVHLISLAGLFLILYAEFIAAAQIVVYAGAVMVLYLFVTAYVGGSEEAIWESIPGQRLLAPVLAGALFVEVSIAVLGTGLKAIGERGPTLPGDFGSPGAIGELLLERFLVVFEAASMLLLIAAVGAIVLAGRRRRDQPGAGAEGGAPEQVGAGGNGHRAEQPGAPSPGRPGTPGRIPASPGSPVADAPSEEVPGRYPGEVASQ